MCVCVRVRVLGVVLRGVEALEASCSTWRDCPSSGAMFRASFCFKLKDKGSDQANPNPFFSFFSPLVLSLWFQSLLLLNSFCCIKKKILTTRQHSQFLLWKVFFQARHGCWGLGCLTVKTSTSQWPETWRDEGPSRCLYPNSWINFFFKRLFVFSVNPSSTFAPFPRAQRE